MPSETTLKKLVSGLKIDSGINVEISKAIKDSILNVNNAKKSLTFTVVS